ncbi:Aspartokinase [Tilletia horrida]|uniref:aspartate kinase n=1 Tax=Tilletia horrida TaxID=155126 RepID=A0AAN6GW59_9BASI|nr:Aspartokinase [Tilletia horrida]KAK0557875.1 Aspartokinase [Tilletia horrida]
MSATDLTVTPTAPPTLLRGIPPATLSPPPWIVQKYGGTSVGKFLPAIAQNIAPSYLHNNRLIIVCSARSGQTKALGTTNLLLQAATQALEGDDSRHGSPSSRRDSYSSPAFRPRGSSSGSETNGVSITANGRIRMGAGSRSSSAMSNSISSLSLTDAPATPETSAVDAMAPENMRAPVSTGFNLTVDRLLSDHLTAARKAITKNSELLSSVVAAIEEDCARLRDFLSAAQIIEEISPKSKDIIIGVGERLACRIVVGALRDSGVDAELVTLDNIVDSSFFEGPDAVLDPSARLGTHEGSLEQNFYDLLARRLGERLQQCTGVPVVTGYFGNVPGSLLTQVGRGYTDLCAALCAVGVGAQELQIWKEVDGVFTADPRKVPTARLIPSITPEEAAELTYYGSEVIHPFTMEQAIKNAIPIRIKNVENPGGSGTVIFPTVSDGTNGQVVPPEISMGGRLRQPQTPSASGSNTPWGTHPGYLVPLSPDGLPIVAPTADGAAPVNGAPGSGPQGVIRRVPTAVTIKDKVVVLNVSSNRKTISHAFFSRIFGTLDRYGVVVDLISTSEVHVSMAIPSNSLRPRTLDRVKSELDKVGTVSVLRDMAILSLVGSHMRHMIGVAGKMFATLGEGNINIEMISQGANEINISCVVHEKSALKALNLIHYSVLEVSPKPSKMEGGNFGRSFF